MAPGSSSSESSSAAERANLPRHVAIIMDGNGRWAQRRGLLRIRGHVAGVESVRTVTRQARKLGISYLTLFAFSEENWQRPAREIRVLMALLRRYLSRELVEMQENQIALKAIGDLKRLPRPVQEDLARTSAATAGGAQMVLTLALSYGGRTEIVQAAQALAREAAAGRLKPEDIDAPLFARYLYTAGLPDPDLLIRTSGECRLSNFLLWQSAYTELYLTETLWPDFREEDFLKALAAYQQRERRFGLTQEQIEELATPNSRH
jgi:undecaprenyl diphosphate synthase